MPIWMIVAVIYLVMAGLVWRFIHIATKDEGDEEQ